MHTPFPRLVIFLLALALCAPGCRPSAPAPTATPTDSRPPLARGDLLLEPCTVQGSRAYCGQIEVYEDRESQSGRKIPIAFAVFPARNKDHQPDPIFYIAGGPGGSGLQSVSVLSSIFSVANMRRDVVLFDQRGVGQLNQLACPEMKPEEDTEAYARRCMQGLAGDPRFYTTAPAMDDLNDIRVALGYDQVNLYGVSYGATAAQVYLIRHPDTVRSVVLDHGTLLDVNFKETMPAVSQQALEVLFRRCAADAGCAAAYPDLEADFGTLLVKLQQPVQTGVPDPTTQEPIVLDRQTAERAIHWLLFTTRQAVRLPQVVHAAARGDWQPLAEVVAQQRQEPAPGQLVMTRVILCYEDWYGFDPTAQPAVMEDTYYQEAVRSDWDTFTTGCPLVPDPGESAHHGPAQPAGVPVLILSGEADPQNPPSNMAGAAHIWPNSVQLIEPGQGHAGMETTCPVQIITQFLREGTGEGLKPDCLAETTLPPFVLP